MISIVVVSHSNKIAMGLKELILDMLPKVDICVAGGTEDNKIGSSFEKISKAVEETKGEEILLFYDLGSSLMNANLVQEMSTKKISIIDSPLVEGTFLAANEIMNNKNVHQIKEILKKEFSYN